MTLETARLLLRGFVLEDAEDVHQYASDPAVCQFTDWGPNSREETEAWVAHAVACGLPGHWAITLKSDALGSRGTVPAGTVVGGVGVYGEGRAEIEATPEVRELGWVVRRDLWGHGIATEAVRAVIDGIVADAGVREVHARCRPEHRASAKVMAHLGLAHARRIERDLERDGRWMDSDLYTLVIDR